MKLFVSRNNDTAAKTIALLNCCFHCWLCVFFKFTDQKVVVFPLHSLFFLFAYIPQPVFFLSCVKRFSISIHAWNRLLELRSCPKLRVKTARTDSHPASEGAPRAASSLFFVHHHLAVIVCWWFFFLLVVANWFSGFFLSGFIKELKRREKKDR